MPDAPYLLIPLRRRDGTTRANAIIDVADARLAEHRWCLAGNGYAHRYGPGNTRIILHRVIAGLEIGNPMQVDHRNGNPLDCRRSNLRVGTHALNQQNMPSMGGSSVHRGVSWSAGAGKWQAMVEVGGRKVWLGTFTDELEAAAAASTYRRAHMPFTNEGRSSHRTPYRRRIA